MNAGEHRNGGLPTEPVTSARAVSTADTRAPEKTEHEAKLLVAGMLAAPVAWLLHLVVSYAIVETTCEHGAYWLHHLVTLLALLLVLPGGWAAWKEWSVTPKDVEDAPRGRHRTHFLAIAGMVNTVFFGLIILLAWSAAIVVGPCDFIHHFPGEGT